MLQVQLCKHLKRTGWVDHNVTGPETVSGHMYRMAMMSFLFGSSSQPNIDRDKCIRMALVHDLAESIVGDLTPSSGVSKEEKYAREKAAMERIQSYLPPEEYEGGHSAEAKVVKDLDKFDMILQAFEYEQAENRAGQLQQFFSSTQGVFVTPEVKEWVTQLNSMRENTLDISPTTDTPK